MSAIINVSSASDYTRKRENDRVEQTPVTYTDLVIYAKVANPMQLAQCNAVSNIEEWLLGMGETQKTISLILVSENKSIFTLVSHTNNSTSEQPDIVETPLSQSAYDRLKLLGITGYTYRRHRYDIPYTTNTWHADVFQDQLGNDHPWVRLTLTVLDVESVVPTIPFAVEDFVYEGDAEMSDTHRTLIAKLWRSEWVALEPVIEQII